MIASDLEAAIARLGELVEAGRVIVPFTGAGISTECGIPDFRSPGGLWTKNQPIPFDAFVASRDMRDESWRRRFAMEQSFAKAKPGRGHRALASLYRAGKVPALITQNIDNLHQSSGIARTRRRRVARQHHLRHLPRLRRALRVVLGQGKIRGGGRARARLQLRRLHQDRDRVVRPGHAGRGDAARRRLDQELRPVSRRRLLAGGVAGGRFSADGQTQRRSARHHQSRADGVRRHCRSGRAQRHRRRARRPSSPTDSLALRCV